MNPKERLKEIKRRLEAQFAPETLGVETKPAERLREPRPAADRPRRRRPPAPSPSRG